MKILPTHYRNPVTMNFRSIKAAVKTLENNGETRYQPMSVAELANVVNFVEASIMSDGIYYDGTLPEEDLEAAQTMSNKLQKNADGISVEAIGEKDKDLLLGYCETATKQASEMMKVVEVAKPKKDSEKNKGISSDDTQAFVDMISADYQNENSRKEVAEDIANQIADGKRTFRGSKCVAGILAAEDDLYHHLKMKFNECNKCEVAYRHLISNLINRFRPNYIPELSNKVNAGYLADGDIVPLQKTQTKFLWKYILEHSSNATELSSIPDASQLFQTNLKSIPVGFSALMRAKTKHPYSMFDEARNLNSTTFDNILGSKKKLAVFLEEVSDKDFDAFSDEVYKKLFMSLSKGSEKGSNLFTTTLDYVPVVIGFGIDVLKDLVTDLSLGIPAGIGALTTGGIKVARVINKNTTYNKYVRHFNETEAFISKTVSLCGAQPLGEQVEDVFGRTLDLSGR